MQYLPSFRYIYNRKKSLNKQGEGLVQLEATYRSTRKYISTGVYVKPQHWNGRVTRHKDVIYLNKQLDKMLAKCNQYFDTAEVFTLNGLESYLKGSDPDNFLEYFKDYLNSRRDITPSTYKQYKSALEHLKGFKQIKSFTDLTFGNIDLFGQYLVSKGLSGQTRRSIHKRVKMVVNHAVDNDRITKNPYRNYKLPKLEPGKIRYLTADQLEAIEKRKFHSDRVTRVKDIFLFQCYTGLAYSDVQKLTPSDIKYDNGDNWIITNRIKTGTESEIFLLPEALKLIDKYKGSETLFPVPSNQKMNEYLKEIQEICGLDTDLTTHVARHTFATQCLTRGVNLGVIARMLGHSSVKTTEKYAKVLRGLIKNEMLK